MADAVRNEKGETTFVPKVMLSWSSKVLGVSSLSIPRELANQFNLMQYIQWVLPC